MAIEGGDVGGLRAKEEEFEAALASGERTRRAAAEEKSGIIRCQTRVPLKECA